MDSTALIKVENLSRFYQKHCAISQLSFSLEPGEVLGFLGPNGAGKSTTMQIITGNLAPSEGQVSICGFDIIDDLILDPQKPGQFTCFHECQVFHGIHNIPDVLQLQDMLL